MKKRLAWLLILMMTLTTVAACGGTEADTFTKRRERKASSEVIVAIGSEPEAGFDSTTGGHGSITRLLFSTLFRRDKALGWENDLATGYSISEDKLTWEVTVREDAVFTNGMPVTAEDVAYTYQTAKDAGADIDLTMVASISVVNPNTVAFKLTRPYSTFMERLAYLGIVPKEAHGEGFKDAPIGSGPFEFVQWDKGQQVIVKANEDYYGEKAKLKKMTLVFLERDVAYTAIQNGDVDAALINGMLAKQAVEGTTVLDLPTIECYGVNFPMVPAEGKKAKDGALMGNDVTSDLAIRQALNVAMDRKAMVEGIFSGYATPSTTGLEKMPWLNQDTVLPENAYGDIEKAKEILKTGGWVDSDGDGILEKEGLKASFNLLYTSGANRQELGLAFADTAKQLGIEVALELVTWDTILPKIHTNAVLYGFGSGDPSELYNLYYGGIAGGVVPWDNSGVYNNPKVNAAIDQALSAKDETEALPYWQALQAYTSAKADAPYCWLVNANHVYLLAEDFSFGTPLVQPHGGRIFDNAYEWEWQ
ncbi:ABC transporter substrate-binding protein [Fusibacter sp. JL298sf-3]